MTNQVLANAGLSVPAGYEPGLPFMFEPKVALGACQIFPGVKIGCHSYMNSGLIRENVVIGRYCSIGRHVTIGTANHDYLALSTNPFFKNNSRGSIAKYADHSQKVAVLIGHDVWIGDNVLIMSGVKIGDGAVVGAGSVVTKDIAPYSIAFGAPAAHWKWRFDPDIIKRLNQVKWPEFSPDRLARLDVADVAKCLNELERWPDHLRDMKEFKYVVVNKS